MMGRRYRGISYDFYSPDRPPPAEESEEIHAHHLETDRRNRRRAFGGDNRVSHEIRV